MYEIKTIKDYLVRIEEAIIKKDNEIELLKNSGFGKFKEYPKQTQFEEYNGVKLTDRYLGYGIHTKSRPYNTPQEAMSALDKAFENAKKVDEINSEVGAFNNNLYRKLITLLESCGLTKTTRQKKSPRSIKYVTEKAEWYNNIYIAMPKCAGYYKSSEVRYAEYKKEIEAWQKSIEDEKLKLEKEELDRKTKRQQDINIAYLIHKYNLGIESTPEDLLEAILKKSQYLMLAHYMQENRSDWSDGPEYVEYGLQQFKVTNNTDEEIVKEISCLVNEWEGDGRCFRDCNYNYNILFGMVDTELLEDYNKAIKTK